MTVGFGNQPAANHPSTLGVFQVHLRLLLASSAVHLWVCTERDMINKRLLYARLLANPSDIERRVTTIAHREERVH